MASRPAPVAALSPAPRLPPSHPPRSPPSHPQQLFHSSFDAIATKQSRQTLTHKLDEFFPPVLARLDMNDIDFMTTLDGACASGRPPARPTHLHDHHD